jgi:hypothetical protein
MHTDNLVVLININIFLQGPNDEHASDIIDLAHHIYLITLDGKNHLAPIRDPHVCPQHTQFTRWQKLT